MKTALDRSINRLNRLAPCSEATKWVDSVRNGSTTAQEIWDKCERGDWMLWLCGRLSGPQTSNKRKLLVKASCACARLSLKWAKDNQPLHCIETAEAWTNGNASLKDVKSAAHAAFASDAAFAYAYAYAYAYAAAYAAYASDAAFAAFAVRKNILKRCSDIVRTFYPKCPL